MVLSEAINLPFNRVDLSVPISVIFLQGSRVNDACLLLQLKVLPPFLFSVFLEPRECSLDATQLVG